MMKPLRGWWSLGPDSPEPIMILPSPGDTVIQSPQDRRCVPNPRRPVADVIRHHVTLELESLDRVYLNVYQPELQTPAPCSTSSATTMGRGLCHPTR